MENKWRPAEQEEIVNKNSSCAFCKLALNFGGVYIINADGKYNGQMVHSMCLIKVASELTEENETEEEEETTEARRLEAEAQEMLLGGATEDETDTFVGQRVQNMFGNGHPSICMCSSCAPGENEYFYGEDDIIAEQIYNKTFPNAPLGYREVNNAWDQYHKDEAFANMEEWKETSK